ncbi:MAG: hypothetical protein WC446_00915 [Candidatus Paceibacterota bacterium]|jgi:flavin-dependent dehydrogenase
MKKVAVVGGGVIGQYISWKLSGAGYDVSVFDYRKKENLKDKSCSVLVSERIKDFIPITDDIIENTINYCDINFHKRKTTLRFNPSHLALDKEKLMNLLLELNKESGTSFFFETRIKEIPKGFDYVVGCDGADSIIRKLMNLKSPQIKIGVQWLINTKDNSKTTETFLKNDGFSWRIPRGKNIECGFFGKSEERGENMKGALIPSPRCPLINAGLIFSNIDNVVLCGDSMGLTKPWSGGGIIWNLYAANMLIKNFPDFKKYKKDIVKFFWWKILKGKVLNWIVHFLGRYFPYIIPRRINYDNDFSVAFTSKK